MAGEPRPVRTLTLRRRTVVSVLAGLLGLAIVPAYADQVYPSAGAVDRAKAAVTTAEGQVAALDAQLAALRVHLTDVQNAAGVAAEAYNGAKEAADAADAAADDAIAKANAARAAADQASLLLSQYAAGVYEDSGSLGTLGVFLSDGGPQAVLDRAAGIEAVGTERDRVLREAQSSALLLATLQRAADEARRCAAGGRRGQGQGRCR